MLGPEQQQQQQHRQIHPSPPPSPLLPVPLGHRTIPFPTANRATSTHITCIQPLPFLMHWCIVAILFPAWLPTVGFSGLLKSCGNFTLAKATLSVNHRRGSCMFSFFFITNKPNWYQCLSTLYSYIHSQNQPYNKKRKNFGEGKDGEWFKSRSWQTTRLFDINSIIASAWAKATAAKAATHASHTNAPRHGKQTHSCAPPRLARPRACKSTSCSGGLVGCFGCILDLRNYLPDACTDQ